MNKIMLAGDTHGSYRAVKEKIDFACANKVDRIIILGDFGLWWGHKGVTFIDEINEYARKRNRQIFAIPGNHEDYDQWNYHIANSPKVHGSEWHYLRTNVLLSKRVQAFVWGGKRFAVAGGAVSIDAEWRRGVERGWDIYAKKRVPKQRMWSPDEQLTEAEIIELRSLASVGPKIDYLLTHDCSDRTPWKNRLKVDFDSQMHRQKIDQVLSQLTPKVHFHGHMHESYDWMNLTRDEKTGEGVYVQTYGLECNWDRNSWGILDLDTDEFKFASELN
jgi:predicted phosphodiesterase